MSSKTYTFRGKGLTIHEPWASAIAYAGKDIENRSWYTHYRGPLALHAGRTVRKHQIHLPVPTRRGGPKRPISELILRGQRKYWENIDENDFLSPGKIIAIGEVFDCVDESASPWFENEWGIVLRNIIPIYPIPYKGNRKLFDCTFKYRSLQS